MTAFFLIAIESIIVAKSRVTSIVIIHVAMSYCIFFHFHITEDYIQNYESLPTNSTDGNFLYVEGTRYYDMKHKSDRRMIVSHILALCTWARTEPAEGMDWD